ncbi:SAM-dependent methyltransferase-like protein [Bacillus cereus]|uniref:class I SAM-dependent methyltransferase n=1 Tax=Bacillus cereus TaxID=1396 RepID=UPI00065CC821|nr:protein distantly related to SAM-dependent methyltransferase [Bacillus cereus]KMN71206.1 SAM-dependent methyltransferase-like protein [Bacillus cereus]
MEEAKVVVGAEGYNNNPGWLHTNEEELNLLRRETWLGKFQPNSLSVILAEHVWEHLSYEEGIEAAKICYEFLMENGYIRCTVPDAFFPDEEYQQGVQVGGPGPLDHPAASHKIVHSYKTITSMFESAGFQVRLLEYCDENGKFHYNDWNEKDGFIYRSKRFDHRNRDNHLGFVSLIVDAVKNEK